MCKDVTHSPVQSIVRAWQWRAIAPVTQDSDHCEDHKNTTIVSPTDKQTQGWVINRIVVLGLIR